MKKSRHLLLVIASLVLASCSAIEEDESYLGIDPIDLENFYLGPVSEGEGRLNILAWPGYVESGETDKLIDWVTPFEAETGCKVYFRPYSNSEEAISLTQNTNYDVVAVSSDVLDKFIEQDLLQRINTNLLINYTELYSDLRKPNWATIDGKTYAVAQGRSFNSYIYRSEDFTEPLVSSDIFWEKPDILQNSMSYSLPMYIADAALYLSRVEPSLNIKNIYSLDQTQFKIVLDFINNQKTNGLTTFPDSVKAKRLIQENNYSTGLVWQSIFSELKNQNPNLEYFVPSNGTTGWINSWVIMRDVQNINCAYKWIDWTTSKATNASMSYWFGEAPAHSTACELVFDESHCMRFRANDENFWTRVKYWKAPSETCLDGRTDVECTTYEDWIKAWQNLE
jgi:putative spermidine/putrescine transport system substrate-binding protein